MVVGDTWFTREPARLITYRSGEHRSMIDYILVRAKNKKCVRNVKAIPGMLQHSMVVMDVASKEMERRKEGKFVAKRNTWKLKLANAHSMVVGNTWFTRKPAQLITYRNMKAILGMLQHSMVVMDVTSKEMGRK
ncbi:hypothetical protein HELRODRAFT_184255 [Helobdella robusta]|uniref:Uncharacterized protein n=1 Tax=Helobdella robusta TaxID=6412 RepID=T1FKV1_HELRO|nr:hypothetical protein HELRODRAFT_184255 [Helobdella robusta]ESO04137.1 hypothetical protein HELRODRAFT_184255 [Helobdella robusta]